MDGYKALIDFRDEYTGASIGKGDPYPPEGREIADHWINYLAGPGNRLGKPVIAKVKAADNPFAGGMITEDSKPKPKKVKKLDPELIPVIDSPKKVVKAEADVAEPAAPIEVVEDPFPGLTGEGISTIFVILCKANDVKTYPGTKLAMLDFLESSLWLDEGLAEKREILTTLGIAGVEKLSPLAVNRKIKTMLKKAIKEKMA